MALPSLRTLHQLTGGPEFFDQSEDPDLRLLRTRLLVGGTAFAGGKERDALLRAAEGVGPARDLLEKVLQNGSFLHEELLGHLANRQGIALSYERPLPPIPACASRACKLAMATASVWSFIS